MKQRATLIIAGLIAAALVIGGFQYWRSLQSHVFPDLKGPIEPSVLPARVATDWHLYSDCKRGRLAILLTDEKGPWLGMVHGLKSIGVPVCVTRDPAVALAQKVVAVYPVLTGGGTAPETLRALGAYVREGGTLIAFGVEGGGMQEVFGFADSAGSRQRHEIRFADTPLTHEFLEEEREKAVRFGNPASAEQMYGSLAYTSPREAPLATFEDGSPAITQAVTGKGRAYAFGIDVGHLVLRGQNGRAGELARDYVNGYEPTLDVFLRLLKRMYEAGEPDAVTLHPAPENRAVSVSVTHDVDYTRSMKNAVDYAEFEKSAGIPATYYIQTKYVRDYNDDIFFDDQGVIYLQKLNQLGMEVASHTVAHSRVFAKFPMGDGKEQYPEYQPFVQAEKVFRDASILGELRVSKFLLEHFSGQRVDSFRPGDLSDPDTIAEALTATGYRFSSTLTAEEALTHLPFRQRYRRENDAELDIYEFPVTIEDEKPPRLGDRLPQALETTKRIARYGGHVDILLHPDVLDHKLTFEKGYVAAMKDSAWFGSARQFGTWWHARDRVALSVSGLGAQRELLLEAAEPIEGLTLEVPAGWKLTANEGARQEGRRVIVKRVAGKLTLAFDAG